MDTERLETIVDAYLRGELGPEELATLNRELRSSDAAVRVFWRTSRERMMLRDVLLEQLGITEEDAETAAAVAPAAGASNWLAIQKAARGAPTHRLAAPTRQSQFERVLSFAFRAAAVIAIGILALMVIDNNEPRSQPVRAPEEVARTPSRQPLSPRDSLTLPRRELEREEDTVAKASVEPPRPFRNELEDDGVWSWDLEEARLKEDELQRDFATLPAVKFAGTVAGSGRKLWRGATVTAADKSVQFTLGGYCRVEVLPQSKLRLTGRDQAEKVFLEAGEILCEVDRNIGTFVVETPVGSVAVTGTKFRVRVTEGGGAMKKRMFVKVLLGAVLVSGAWGQTTLRAGEEITKDEGTTDAPKDEGATETPKDEGTTDTATADAPVPKGIENALQKHIDKENYKLGTFVLQKLAEGLRGQELANAIHEKNAELKAARKDKGDGDDDDGDDDGDDDDGDGDDGDEAKGPGEALKHGLEDKEDMAGLGRFVNEKLAEGLRGEELAKAIHEEQAKRKEARNEKREAKRGEREEKRETKRTERAERKESRAESRRSKRESKAARSGRSNKRSRARPGKSNRGDKKEKRRSRPGRGRSR